MPLTRFSTAEAAMSATLCDVLHVRLLVKCRHKNMPRVVPRYLRLMTVKGVSQKAVNRSDKIEAVVRRTQLFVSLTTHYSHPLSFM